ncbi:hypothetical protein JCM8547_005382 [Rhodosporidiobolus lusitaniae]
MAFDNDDPNRPATQHELNITLGPPVVGWSFAILFFGIYLCCHLQYITGPSYAKAARPVKATLHWVALFESGLPLVSGIVSTSVQSLLMARAASLLRKKAIRTTFLIVTSLLILFSFTSAILITIANFLYWDADPNAIERIHPIDWNVGYTMYLWTSAVIDLVISISLALTLKQRVAGFNEKTDGLLKRLIRNALQTASYTTFLCIVGACVTVALPDSNEYTSTGYAFFAPLPPLYGLSLYTTLSTRRTIDEYTGSSVPIPGSMEHNISSSYHPPRPTVNHAARSHLEAIRLGTRLTRDRDVDLDLDDDEPGGRARKESEAWSRKESV